MSLISAGSISLNSTFKAIWEQSPVFFILCQCRNVFIYSTGALPSFVQGELGVPVRTKGQLKVGLWSQILFGGLSLFSTDGAISSLF